MIQFGLWSIDCKFDAGSWQLLGERIRTLLLTVAELYGLYLSGSGRII